MSATITLFDPSAPSRQADAALSAIKPALDALAGKVVGFIDNAKPNFGLLADDLGALLISRYGVQRVVKRRKPSASVPAKEEVIRELTGECDLIITGSGD
jgi:hypothetical protein